MFQSPILIYSDYCNYCATFITALTKHPDIVDSFVNVNIDVDPQTQQRPRVFYEIQNALQHKISRVPTIIVDEGSYVLTGEDAFKWLEYEVKKRNESSLTPFNPNEMGSFSDQYSKFGSTDLHDATDQSFKFLSKTNDKIYTPEESSIERKDLSSLQKERESLDKIRGNGPAQMGPTRKTESFNQPKIREDDYSALMNQRQVTTQSAPKQNIDFTGASFGFANQMGQGGQRGGFSHKQKEMEMKLQELMSQREEFTPTTTSSVRKEDIDWTRGTMNH